MKSEQYNLSPKAEQDLENIWNYGVDRWSVDQAEKYIGSLVQIFDLVSGMPEIGLLQSEFIIPIRTYFHGTHVIIYKPTTPLEILRIVHQSSDWLEFQGFENGI